MEIGFLNIVFGKYAAHGIPFLHRSEPKILSPAAPCEELVEKSPNGFETRRVTCSTRCKWEKEGAEDRLNPISHYTLSRTDVPVRL